EAAVAATVAPLSTLNIKMSAIELQPIAIMDPTRFNVELTYMGSGNIRVRTDPVNDDGTADYSVNTYDNYGAERNSSGNIIYHTDTAGNRVPNDRWILQSEINFPVKTLLRPVVTTIFSGLTASEIGSFFQSFSSQQKTAFEDCPAATGWLIDMSMTENRVVPGSLADMVLTFYFVGYYDNHLKSYIDQFTRNESNIINRVISARTQFSDQFFSFQRTGKISFNVTAPMLTVNERIDELVN
ncbi:MAG: hypothetical protein ACMG6E_01870, partial [Candidatus Roizmanbacteria bacterium]